MAKLSDLVEELQEELAETKNQLSSLEEEHEYLENSFEMYKEEMQKTVKEMYKNMQDLYRSMETIHTEIAPALRGKSYGAGRPNIQPAFTAPSAPHKTFDPNTMTWSIRDERHDPIYPPHPTVKELKSRFVDLNTVK